MGIDVLLVLAVGLLFAVTLFLLRNPVALDDGLRHFAMARLLQEQGIANAPGWNAFLYEGYFHDRVLDPWFLSHVLLLPLTPLSAHIALKISALVSLVALSGSFILLLRSYGLRARTSAIFLLILLFADQQFLGRLLLGRPYALLTAFVVLTLYAVHKRSTLLLFAIAVATPLLSQLFVFTLLLALGGAIWLCTIRQERPSGIAMLIASITGTGIGIALHPHSAEYLTYLWTVFLRIPFLKADVPLSNEMHSGFLHLTGISVAIALGLIILLTAASLKSKRSTRRKLHRAEVTFLACAAILCTLGFALWIRMIDILWPILIALLARIVSIDPKAPLDLLQLLPRSRAIAILFPILVALQIIIVPAMLLKRDAQNSLEPLAGIESIPPHTRVLNADWDLFFAFVYLRPDLRYALGIDPSLTYLTDPDVLKNLQALETSSSDAQSRSIVRALLRTYPSDVLIFSEERYSAVLPSLMTMPELALLSRTGALASFSIRSFAPSAR
ncbi:MAG: hypothetical protein Q7R81_06065 [Candidatus Peregrinibacteria bacterium]|nr:hypothetical protein [Candidatus Peregrinibacteria bacterium]